MDLVFLKTNRVHIFLCYFWFKSFPVLLFVLISISRFNFILVLFNLNFFLWSIAGDFKQEENQEIFAGACEIHNLIRMGCEISHTLRTKFSHPAKISQPLQNHFNHCAKFLQTMRKISQRPKPFHNPQSHFTHCVKLKKCVRKWKATCHFFLNPPSSPEP